MREIWKPLVLLVVAAGLIGWALQLDPEHPRCGNVEMQPAMVCETQSRGAPRQRTYAEMRDSARAWQLGAPIAGTMLGLTGLAWIGFLVAQRRRATPPGPAAPVGPPPGAAPRTPQAPDPRFPQFGAAPPPGQAPTPPAERQPWPGTQAPRPLPPPPPEAGPSSAQQWGPPPGPYPPS